MLEKAGADAQTSEFDAKTQELIDRAMKIAEARRFRLGSSRISHGGLSSCMGKLVDEMLARVLILIGGGNGVADAINSGIDAVKRERTIYTRASRDEAAGIVETILGGQVEVMLQMAHDRMQYPVRQGSARIKSRHRNLRPAGAY